MNDAVKDTRFEMRYEKSTGLLGLTKEKIADFASKLPSTCRRHESFPSPHWFYMRNVLLEDSISRENDNRFFVVV